MSIEDIIKVLIKNTTQSLDKRLITEDVNASIVMVLSLLVEYIKYCTFQYNAGNTEYYDKVKSLSSLILDLKYRYSETCTYKYKDPSPVSPLNKTQGGSSGTFYNIILSDYSTDVFLSSSAEAVWGDIAGDIMTQDDLQYEFDNYVVDGGMW